MHQQKSYPGDSRRQSYLKTTTDHQYTHKIYYTCYWGMRCGWPSGTVPDFAIARSRVRLLPVATVHQRQLSVPSLRGRLMSTSESWGVNGHTTRCTSPVSVVLQLRLVSGWGLQETEISAALWALEARERTLLYWGMRLKQVLGDDDGDAVGIWLIIRIGWCSTLVYTMLLECVTVCYGRARQCNLSWKPYE